jgi:hypothetical protein
MVVKHGPPRPPGHHEQIAEIVARFSIRLRETGRSWPPRASLREICAALDEREIPIPENWKAGRTERLRRIGLRLNDWSDALDLGFRDLVERQIRHCIVRHQLIESRQNIGAANSPIQAATAKSRRQASLR